jgi:hypothetical protein
MTYLNIYYFKEAPWQEWVLSTLRQNFESVFVDLKNISSPVNGLISEVISLGVYCAHSIKSSVWHLIWLPS